MRSLYCVHVNSFFYKYLTKNNPSNPGIAGFGEARNAFWLAAGPSTINGCEIGGPSLGASLVQIQIYRARTVIPCASVNKLLLNKKWLGTSCHHNSPELPADAIVIVKSGANTNCWPVIASNNAVPSV